MIATTPGLIVALIGEAHIEGKRVPRVILTFRIERKILKELRSESKLKGESLNVLINQLLKSYVDYHKPTGKAGNIYFPKGALVQGRV